MLDDDSIRFVLHTYIFLHPLLWLALSTAIISNKTKADTPFIFIFGSVRQPGRWDSSFCTISQTTFGKPLDGVARAIHANLNSLRISYIYSHTHTHIHSRARWKRKTGKRKSSFLANSYTSLRREARRVQKRKQNAKWKAFKWNEWKSHWNSAQNSERETVIERAREREGEFKEPTRRLLVQLMENVNKIPLQNILQLQRTAPFAHKTPNFHFNSLRIRNLAATSSRLHWSLNI